MKRYYFDYNEGAVYESKLGNWVIYNDAEAAIKAALRGEE